jgi:hypothetical protein
MTIIASGYVNPLRPATVAFADAGGSSSNPANTYTFSGQNLGTPDASRRMIIMVRSQNANSGSVGDVDSISIGGTGCSRRLTMSNGLNHWSTWTCTKPTGTTGSVVINYPGGDGFSYAYWVMFAAYDLLSVTPTDSDVVFDFVPATDPVNNSTDIDFRGILVAMAERETGGGSAFGWTGATEVADLNVGVASSSRISGAIINKVENAGTRPGTYPTSSNTGGAHHQWAVAFR